MNGKELLLRIGMSRKQSENYGPALDEVLKEKEKEEKIVLESKDVTEPLDTYRGGKKK